jgi:hypothetical protein
MNKIVWVLQVVVALAFTGSGGMKLATSGEALRTNPRMGWAKDFSDPALKAIGGAEVAGAVGLIAPAATGIAPFLTPVAGVALAALMGGAASVHIQRGESPVAPIVLALLALTVSVLRWRMQRRG